MAVNIATLPPHVKVAVYNTDQVIPRYRGNKLIEAFPEQLSEEGLIAALELEPDYSIAARSLPAHIRVNETLALLNFMKPLACHMMLGFKLDSMVREGCVGRRPFSREHMAIFQEIHDLERANKPFRQTRDTVNPKISAALINISGMGKTTTAQRIMARFPPVIYHPELDLFHVSYLHIEMPSSGGVKALAMAIIDKLDELIPGSDYHDRYVAKSWRSPEFLIRIAARLMNKHLVGLLIADEVQRIGNARKDQKTLMDELVSLCNRCKVPQLYIGTNKANRILGLDFSSARRGLNMGLGDWGPLPKWEVLYSGGERKYVRGEWLAFVEQLWSYQWTKQHAELTSEIIDTLFNCTQGVIDLLLKLFIIAQARAIIDQTEIVTDALLKDVYESDMKLVHPMVNALQTGDIKALMKYEDMTPINASDMLEDLFSRYRAGRVHAASSRPGEADFEHRLATAAQVLGMTESDASDLARQVNKDGTAKDMLDAVAQLAKKAAPPKPVKAKSGRPSKNAGAAAFPNLSLRPQDYRNAVTAAAEQGTLISEQMARKGFVTDVEKLLGII